MNFLWFLLGIISLILGPILYQLFDKEKINHKVDHLTIKGYVIFNSISNSWYIFHSERTC